MNVLINKFNKKLVITLSVTQYYNKTSAFKFNLKNLTHFYTVLYLPIHNNY